MYRILSVEKYKSWGGRVLGIPKKHIKRLDVNGLSGRMLSLPKPRKSSRQILLIYDAESTLEQIYPLAQYLHSKAGVIVPDLPGFGGMDSLFKLSMHTGTESLADYVASIIKLHFGKQKFVVAGAGYGFAVICELLQKYPNITQRVDFVINLGGMMDNSELNIPTLRKYRQRVASKILRRELPVAIAQGFGRLWGERQSLATRLQVQHDVAHLHMNRQKLPRTVYYFPARLNLPIDQTKAVMNLKTVFKKVVVATDVELSVVDGQFQLRPLHMGAQLPWLAARQRSLKRAVLHSDDARSASRHKIGRKALKLPAKA